MVYSKLYNIGFCGIENFHPFDSKKFSKIVANLTARGLLRHCQLIEPAEVSEQALLDVHTLRYLTGLNRSSRKVAQVIEMWPLGLLPAWLTRRRVVEPMRRHTAGTMLASALAFERGWSINLGGGMHHASTDNGEGWCMYSDLILATRKLRKASGGRVQKVMIIDLDVHQGNGHERDKLHFQDSDLHILDIYNCDLWPGDTVAQKAIDTEVLLTSGTSDEEYLSQLEKALNAAFGSFHPDLVLYNAGTDILVGDPLGKCDVSQEGVVQRDLRVFQQALTEQVPICMVLAGGYTKITHKVISESIATLMRELELS
eukprot:jgi/Astpho2/2995/fgenesh1_pm.00051_%23_11_t